MTPRPQPEEEPRTPAGMPKTADYLYAYSGMWDREPKWSCWVRVFEERTPDGRLGRKATWDRLSFYSWGPRRVWLSGQERIAFGVPHWEHLPDQEVEQLIGNAEMTARPPEMPVTNGRETYRNSKIENPTL